MNVEYLPTFLKDLKALKHTDAFELIKTLTFEEIPNCSSSKQIRNLTKLSGYADCYRIRVGDYRIGLIVSNDVITFARVLHQREIYRYFP